MEKCEIVQQAQQLKTPEDLLNLLNAIKRDLLVARGQEEHYFPFTMKQLRYYCNPRNTHHRYTTFKIPKKSGAFREIASPRNRSFKMMLQCVNELLKALYTPSNYAMGFAEGRSVVMNADCHRGQNYVLNLDMKDFFPSIEQARVWGRLQIAPFHFSKPIASLIAGLCAMEESCEEETPYKERRYVLPQGAPTSPIITNMICDKLDRRLAGLAHRFGLRYSRYADDITFSSMHYVYSKKGPFWKELQRIITDQRFTINEAKTRLQKRGRRQEVTGIIVSEKLNVSRAYIKSIRAFLFFWERFGYGVAFNRFTHRDENGKGLPQKRIADPLKVIAGKLNFLKMVKGENDSVYQRLHSSFEELRGDLVSARGASSTKVLYLETVPLREFEAINETKVEFTTSEKAMDSAKSEVSVGGESLESSVETEVSVKTRRYATFTFDGKKILASVYHALTQEDLEAHWKLAVSLCQSEQGDFFWLISKLSKRQRSLMHGINIDELNNRILSLIHEQEDGEGADDIVDLDKLNEELAILLHEQNG